MERSIADRLEAANLAVRGMAARALGTAALYLDRRADDALQVDINQLATMFDRIGVPESYTAHRRNREEAANAIETAYQHEPNRELADRILFNLQFGVLSEVDDDGYTLYHRGLEEARSEDPPLTAGSYMQSPEFVRDIIATPSGADTYRSRVNVWESYADVGDSLGTPYLSRIWFAHKITPGKRDSVLNMSFGINTDQLGRDLRGLATLAILEDYVMRFPHAPGEDVINRHQQGDSSIVYKLTDELALLCQLDLESERVNFIVQAMNVSGHDATEEEKDEFFEFAVQQQVDVLGEVFPGIIDDILNILGAPNRPEMEIRPDVNDIDDMSDQFVKEVFGVERDKLDVPVQLKDEDMIEMYKELTSLEPRHTLDMIGGAEEVVNFVVKQANKLKNRARHRRAGTEPQPRVLLKGKKGTGKTMIAEAIADYLGGPLLRVTPKDIGSKYVNEGEQKVALVFRVAQAIATPERPVVLLMDELDTSTSNRGDSGGDHESYTRALGQMLNEMNRVMPNVFIIGATNAEGAIDDALIRHGRFNHVQKVPEPDEATMAKIFERRIAVHVAKSRGALPVESNIDLVHLSKVAKKLGLTGAGIEVAVREAIENAEDKAEQRGDDSIQTLTAANIEHELRSAVQDRERETRIGHARVIDEEG